MRVTIVREDGLVLVDGAGFGRLDLSMLPSNVHAVQWYGTDGEVEYVDEHGRASFNERITDFTPYQPALDRWAEAKKAHEAEEAASAATSMDSASGDTAIQNSPTE
jgi:hypothetical protein